MKLHAITENHLYKKAYAKGKRFVTPALALYILPDYQAARLQKAHPQHLRVNRIGLTVSKKIGGATVRSRVRRILREAYRQVEREYGIKAGLLVVIAAREAARDAKSTELARQLAYAMRKLEILQS